MQMVNATGAEGIKVQDTVVFEHKEYEVTPTIANLCNCCTLKVMLMLEPDEVVYTTDSCCVHQKKRLPYGDTGRLLRVFGCPTHTKKFQIFSSYNNFFVCKKCKITVQPIFRGSENLRALYFF